MNRILAKSMIALAASAALFTVPTVASAGDRYGDRDRVDFRVDYREHDHGFRREEPRRVWVEPVYEERCNKVWVAPVYRTECTPVLVTEGFNRTVCKQVWVEPLYEVREVVRVDRFGRRICTRERVCVRPGHFEERKCTEWVPAQYRNEERQVMVSDGHWEEQRQRVCVREGHWDTVVDHRQTYRGGGDRLSVNIGGIFR